MSSQNPKSPLRFLAGIIPLLVFIVFISCRKEEVKSNCYHSYCFSRIVVSENITYGENISQAGENIFLKMDVYEPENDSSIQRPLLILAHGGHFKHGSKAGMAGIADYFAHSGYVVASINYRLIDNGFSTTSFERALIDGFHDMKAAIRFFYRDASETGIFRIDTNKIFIGGYSVGAMMALHTAYIDSNSDLEEVVADSLYGYFIQNGGVEGGSGNSGYSSQVKGVINLSGGLLDHRLIDTGEPAIFSVHGAEDPIVAIDSGYVVETETLLYGVEYFSGRLTTFGIRHHDEIIEGEKHGAYHECEACDEKIRSFLFELF